MKHPFGFIALELFSGGRAIWETAQEARAYDISPKGRIRIGAPAGMEERLLALASADAMAFALEKIGIKTHVTF